MPVKGNQPALLEALQVWFEQPLALRGLDRRTGRQVEKGHGRLEQRTLTASTELNDYLDWPGLQQVVCAQRRFINTKTGVVSHEVRYAVTSLSPQQADAAALLDLWRSHWTIENHLHWPRDVLFGEDDCKTHAQHSPRALATLRNTALSVIRVFGHPSIQAGREYCAAHPVYAFGLLFRSVYDWFE